MALSKDSPPNAEPDILFSSETTISWVATLHPFADELPAGTDWVDFVKSVNPSGEIGQLVQRWTQEESATVP